MATMKETWKNYFEVTLKKSVNKIFKETFEFSDLGEMSEENIVQMNESIKLYRASRKFMEEMCDVYDKDVAKLKQEVAELKEQNEKILAILEEIRGKQLPVIKG